MAEINLQDLTVKTKEGNTNTYEFVQPDGYYQEMTVGDAEQLVATVGVTDKVPYLSRTSGGSADIGNRANDEITGGSLVWNQLVQNGNFESGDNWSSAGTATKTYANNKLTIVSSAINAVFRTVPIVANHVYLLGGTLTSTISSVLLGVYKNASGTLTMSLGEANVKKRLEGILKPSASLSTDSWDVRIRVNVADSATTVVEDVIFIDLTAMFGSTIADYVYSLETATAGAGVAWFKKLFPKPYYPYQPVDMRHVSGVSAHRMVGFNAYNPETGTAVLLGGNQYQITGAYTALSYTDIGGNAETITPDSNGLFTPSANGTLTVTGGNSTDTCVHLVWSGTHNGEYEPYEVHEYALDDSLTLRGIPKLDANNELYYDGDTYASDGTVTRRYGIVDLGTLTWTQLGTRYYSSGVSSLIKSVVSTDMPNIKAQKVPTVTAGQLAGDDNLIGIGLNGTNLFARFPSGESISGYLVYELATPTTETAEPYTNPQIVNDWGTEEYVTDSIVPVGHTTTYGANLRDKLQHLPDLADNDGNFLIQQTGTQMVLVPFRIPQATGADGTYVLKATVSGGTPTYSWVLEE